MEEEKKQLLVWVDDADFVESLNNKRKKKTREGLMMEKILNF
jgi:hypothetical protein